MYSHDVIEVRPDNSIPCPSGECCDCGCLLNEFAAWEMASDEALYGVEALIARGRHEFVETGGVPLVKLGEDLGLEDGE